MSLIIRHNKFMGSFHECDFMWKQAERVSKTENESKRERQSDSQWETERPSDIQTKTERNKQTDGQRHTDWRSEKVTDRHTDRDCCFLVLVYPHHKRRKLSCQRPTSCPTSSRPLSSSLILSEVLQTYRLRVCRTGSLERTLKRPNRPLNFTYTPFALSAGRPTCTFHSRLKCEGWTLQVILSRL